jgi:hypothetical protein
MQAGRHDGFVSMRDRRRGSEVEERVWVRERECECDAGLSGAVDLEVRDGWM